MPTMTGTQCGSVTTSTTGANQFYDMSNGQQLVYPNITIGQDWLNNFDYGSSLQAQVNNHMQNLNDKFYRVIKETPAWGVDAIITNTGTNGGYQAVNRIWDKECAEDIQYYEHKQVVEKSPDYFARVYKVKVDGKDTYKPKEEAQKIIAGQQA